MTKADLKSLIKECLIEILSESASSSAQPTIRTEQRRPQQQRPVQQQTSAQRAASSKSFATESQQKRPAVPAKPRIDPLFEAFSNPSQMMQEAASRVSASDPMNVSHEEQVMAQGDAAQRAALTVQPNDIFDDKTLSKWSQMFLLFNNKLCCKTKKKYCVC